jgi:hypothetical protein
LFFSCLWFLFFPLFSFYFVPALISSTLWWWGSAGEGSSFVSQFVFFLCFFLFVSFCFCRSGFLPPADLAVVTPEVMFSGGCGCFRRGGGLCGPGYALVRFDGWWWRLEVLRDDEMVWLWRGVVMLMFLDLVLSCCGF